MRFYGPGSAAGTALAALLFSVSASAMTISSGGFDQALGCSSVACGSTQTFELNPATPLADAAGSVDLDPTALTLTFELNIASLSLTGVGGTPDNGVGEVLFINTVYHAVGLSLLDVAGTFIIAPAQTASVSGIQSQGGPPSGFTALDARVNGTCAGSGSGLVCGIQFGQANFSLDVGSSDPQTRYFQHTANIIAVPEASSLALLGAALLAGVAATRRR